MSLPRGARAAHRAHAPQPCRPCNAAGPLYSRRRKTGSPGFQMVLTERHPGPACLFTTASTKHPRYGGATICLARSPHRKARPAHASTKSSCCCAWPFSRCYAHGCAPAARGSGPVHARVPRLALLPRSAVWTHGSAALPVPSQASRAHLHTRTRARVTAGHAVAQARAARFLPSFNLAGRGAKQCLDSSTAMRRVLWF